MQAACMNEYASAMPWVQLLPELALYLIMFLMQNSYHIKEIHYTNKLHILINISLFLSNNIKFASSSVRFFQSLVNVETRS